MDTRLPGCAAVIISESTRCIGAQAAPEGGVLEVMIQYRRKKPAVLQDHGAGAGATFCCTGGSGVLAEDIPIFEEANIA